MALPQPYSPLRWYWIIGGSTTQVWSSASLSLLAVSDTTYAAWRMINRATSIVSAGALAGVMFQQVEPYVMGKGVPVTSTGTSALNATYDASTTAMNRLVMITSMIANSKGLPAGAGTFSWPDLSGNFHSFSATNIVNLAFGLSDFVYKWEQAIATRVGGGSATLPTTVTIA